MTGVFVNYRNADLPEVAAIIYRSIADRLGEAEVFRDLNTMQAGEHYPTSLRRALHDADILIAVVGPNWLAPVDPDNPADQGRLIDRDSDWVRMEIAEALRRGIPVVPVLLNDTPPPDPASLPADIRDLAKKQAHKVHRDRLDEDLNRLVSRLLELVPRLGTSRLFESAPPAWHPDSAPSTLLRAEHAVVPLSGCRPVLDHLYSWATGPDARSARLMTGPAASGKTRIAMALRDRLAVDRWLAGFVSEHAPPDDIAHISRVDQPLLLIVDDMVPARVKQLATLATAMAQRAGRQATPTRMLLLSRHATDWLSMLHGHDQPPVREAFRPLTVTDLSKLNPTVPATQFDAARRAFALALGRPVPADATASPVGSAEVLLDVHAAALNDVLSPGRPDAQPAIRQLVHRGDRQQFRTLARQDGRADLETTVLTRIAAVVTLCRPASGEQASTVRCVLPAFFADDSRLSEHIDMYRRLYPGPHLLDPVHPEAVGHEVIAAAIRAEPVLGTTLATACTDDQLVNVLTVLGSALPRHPELTTAVLELIQTDADRIGPLGVDAASRMAEPNDGFLEQLGTAIGAGTRSVPAFRTATARMNDRLPASVRSRLIDSTSRALTQVMVAQHWQSHRLRLFISSELYGQFVRQIVEDTVLGHASADVWEASDNRVMTSWVAAALLRMARRRVSSAIGSVLERLVNSERRSNRDGGQPAG